MIRLKLGCNFDLKLLDGVTALNEESDACKIVELYGSDRRHAALTARPEYRLPDVDLRELENYVGECVKLGLSFNYTMNTPYPGPKREIEEQAPIIQQFVGYLQDIGVTTLTVATPLLAQIIRDRSSSIAIEVSTIANVDSVTQIKAWKDRYDVAKVCIALSKNRSFHFLANAGDYCRKNDVQLTVIANEFCSTGGMADSSSTGCIYRQSCYLCHAGNIDKEDDLRLKGYPMSQCMASRTRGASWLKCMFIRPEDMSYYSSLGVDQFKITGRTGTTDYLLFIARAYLRQRWDGNLLTLWKPLQTIRSGKEEAGFRHPICINNSQLGEFLNYWKENEHHDCANELCGDTCTYCDCFFGKMSKSPPVEAGHE